MPLAPTSPFQLLVQQKKRNSHHTRMCRSTELGNLKITGPLRECLVQPLHFTDEETEAGKDHDSSGPGRASSRASSRTQPPGSQPCESRGLPQRPSHFSVVLPRGCYILSPSATIFLKRTLSFSLVCLFSVSECGQFSLFWSLSEVIL